jgi:hypothetical protein
MHTPIVGCVWEWKSYAGMQKCHISATNHAPSFTSSLRRYEPFRLDCFQFLRTCFSLVKSELFHQIMFDILAFYISERTIID